MILSSTSVRFMTCFTLHPRRRSVRRSRSSNRNVRKLPRCAGLYTVGPHVYINTVEPSAGANGSIVRVSVLRSEEHTSELQSHVNLVCRLLLEKKKRGGACC